MAYELWDRESGNLIDSFSTEAEALAVVRVAIEEDGKESIEGWMLGRSDGDGNVLTGSDLAARAMPLPTA